MLMITSASSSHPSHRFSLSIEPLLYESEFAVDQNGKVSSTWNVLFFSKNATETTLTEHHSIKMFRCRLWIVQTS